MFDHISDKQSRKILAWFFWNYQDEAYRLKRHHKADVKGFKKTLRAIIYEFKRKNTKDMPFGSYLFHTTRYSKHYGIKQESRYVFVEKKKARLRA